MAGPLLKVSWYFFRNHFRRTVLIYISFINASFVELTVARPLYPLFTSH
jgi:hypothetical protein